ncbi:hypothetical protein PR048_014074 [Dryococelus australis]|uniref:Uncharacterized protein n=1 Tax=Dryococelus australis TaxID=614101 RepID=A0ABQ9HUV9_9NEOP|nr:hypothetical protein PR048_014074 [Dryococelus australis]
MSATSVRKVFENERNHESSSADCYKIWAHPLYKDSSNICWMNYNCSMESYFCIVSRFSDFSKISLVSQFVSFPWATQNIEDLSSSMETTFNIDGTATEHEFISMRDHMPRTKEILDFIPQEKYLVLTDVALWVTHLLTSTYLRESSF